MGFVPHRRRNTHPSGSAQREMCSSDGDKATTASPESYQIPKTNAVYSSKKSKNNSGSLRILL